MYIFSARLHFALHAVFSLKEKRQVARSLMEKTRHKFHCSIAEVDVQDSHHDLVLGVVLCTGTHAHGQEQLEHILRYLDAGTDAELIEVQEQEYRLP